MRVMFTVFPAPAHFLPIVPYAWALQSAGHSVRIASAPGYPSGVAVADFHEVVKAAGLTAVTCGEPEPLAVHDRAYPGFAGLLPSSAESERFTKALALDAGERETWELFYSFILLAVRNYQPPRPRQDVRAVVDFARRWRPDLVLWDPWFPCGAVAARVCGAAHARVLNAPDYSGWAAGVFAARGGRPGARVPENPLMETLRPLADLYGVQADDELMLGQWTLDPFPAAMNLPTRTVKVPVRYVPYTGASVLPEWLYERPGRPRIGISLGVSSRGYFHGDWRTARLLEAVAGLDAEVVATLNEDQLKELPFPVPANVRTYDYVPLDQLLPTCSVSVHHGAPGTMMAAAAAGVPQLVCDTDEPLRLRGAPGEDGIDWDVPFERQLTSGVIAGYVTDRGAGVRLNHQTQSAQEIRAEILRVLTEPSFAEGATKVREEWLAAPSPVDVVPVLEELTARHRGRDVASRRGRETG